MSPGYTWGSGRVPVTLRKPVTPPTPPFSVDSLILSFLKSLDEDIQTRVSPGSCPGTPEIRL